MNNKNIFENISKCLREIIKISFLIITYLTVFSMTMVSSKSIASQYACYEIVGDAAGLRPFDDPCPEKGDVRIPMPGGLIMVFRLVTVPGGEFWGNPARNVQLGDPDARIFEGPRLVSVSGSFPSEDGQNWHIVMAKYEVSVAQMATVFGEGDLTVGLEILSKRSLFGNELLTANDDNTSENLRRRILAAPARGLSLSDIQQFIDTYTRWCYSSDSCIASLPQYGSLPAFFRLPTEIEWEYTARNHSDGVDQISILPFEPNEIRNFAYVSTATRNREGPTSIGRLSSTQFGMHDLYGNVAELLDGRFLAELGQGKPGMRVSRGGSYAFNAQFERLRPSTRVEVQEWRIDENDRIVPVTNARLGIRLALGSHTVPDIETLDNLEDTYADYKSTDRLNSSAATSTQASVLNIAEPLNGIDTLISNLVQRGNLDVSSVEQIKRYTKSARNNINRTSEALSVELIRQAISMAAEGGRNLHRIRQRERLVSLMSNSNTEAGRSSAIAGEKAIDEFTYRFQSNVEEYKNTIFRLAGYREYATEKLQSMQGSTNSNRVISSSVSLVEKHTLQVINGKTVVDEWQSDIENVFADESLFDTN